MHSSHNSNTFNTPLINNSVLFDIISTPGKSLSLGWVAVYTQSNNNWAH